LNTVSLAEEVVEGKKDQGEEKMVIFFIIGIAIVAVTVIVLVVLRNRKIMNELINQANQGDVQAQYDLARKYQQKKPDEALQLFEKSAKNGHPQAQLVLGIIYKEGNGVEKNPVQAVHWFEQAAEQGLADAQYELGYCYMMGQGIKEDDVKAFSWFEKAGANGSTNAQTFKSLADVQFKMALAYKVGEEGKEKDLVKAMTYLEKAADQKHKDAQYELGYCYMTGQGINEDDVKAFSWFEKAAANGSTNARSFKSLADVQYKMALDNKDPAKASTWLMKAADQGHADAQYKVALNYLTGKEESKDPTQAVSWLIKAANQNHADAQYELGCCYMRGTGVAENKNLAINWFEKAVANGSDNAQAVVGFKKIEQDSRFRSTAKVVVKEMQYELVKAGYKLSYFLADSSAYIKVSGGPKDEDGGSIRIWSSEEDEEGIFISGSYGATNKKMTIIDEKRGLEIYSDSPSKPGQFPKWLKICASPLKGKISDPKWINNPELPWLKDYINSVLKA